MNIAKSTLALLTIGSLCCSIALAKPIRGTFTPMGATFFGVDASGNQVSNSPNAVLLLRGVKFPKSGIIINRGNQKNTLNLSGKRQVFRNANADMFDPETNAILSETRSRQIYPKGKPSKNNLVRQRIFSVFNPKKAP